MRIELAKPTIRLEVDLAYLALAVGLTTIFLANAIGAVVDPGSYEHILQGSAITRWIGLDRQSWATTVIAINDGAIAAGLVAATVTRRWQRAAVAVAGVWLAIAAVLKLTACLG